MALLLGNCHSILVTGNLLKTNTISIKLPFDDFKSNLWQIRINDLCVDYKSKCNVLVGLSLNFITDVKYNEQNEVVSCFPIIAQTVLKGEISEKKVYKFESAWFYVTNPNHELKLTFNPYNELKVDQSLLALNCNVFATILLQRVK